MNIKSLINILEIVGRTVIILVVFDPEIKKRDFGLVKSVMIRLIGPIVTGRIGLIMSQPQFDR